MGLGTAVMQTLEGKVPEYKNWCLLYRTLKYPWTGLRNRGLVDNTELNPS